MTVRGVEMPPEVARVIDQVFQRIVGDHVTKMVLRPRPDMDESEKDTYLNEWLRWVFTGPRLFT
jgi:hypothetical protein